MPSSIAQYLDLLDEQREAIFHELGPLPDAVLWYRRRHFYTTHDERLLGHVVLADPIFLPPLRHNRCDPSRSP